MKKLKRGFTLLEVAIFLAITGLLFIGITAGVQTSLNQQRSNDTVQDFMEFLRKVYSQVNNVQNPNVGSGGQSNKAIYGKLVTFGEECDLTGCSDDSAVKAEARKKVFVYTVVGGISDATTGGALEALNQLQVDVIKKEDDVMSYLGLVESYEPKWTAELQVPCTNLESDMCPRDLFKGSLLIVRHPRSGNTYTYYSNKVVPVNSKVWNSRVARAFGDDGVAGNDWKFQEQQVDFCLNVSDKAHDDDPRYNERYDVRIVKGARNASGVELIPDNNAAGVTGGSNRCKK